MAAVVERFRQAAAGSSSHGPQPTTTCCACTRRGISQAMIATRGQAVMLDPDTFTSPDSEDVARLAAGAVLTGVDTVLDGPPGSRALVVVRPPGHHAEPEPRWASASTTTSRSGRPTRVRAGCRAGGDRGLRRAPRQRHAGDLLRGPLGAVHLVAPVSVLPGHRRRRAKPGRGAGLGFTLNLPSEPARPTRRAAALRAGGLPKLERVRPELLMISAGFDAHERDPLAGCRMTTEGFRAPDDDAGERGRPAVRGPRGARDRGRLRPGRRSANACRPSSTSAGSWTDSLNVMRTSIPRREHHVADYHPQELDRKWQAHWAETRAFEVTEDPPQAEVLLPRDVRVPVRARARRPRPQLHHRRRRRAAEAAAGLQRPAPVRVGRVRPAGRERGDQERHPSRDIHARQHRPHEGAAAAPRHQLRVGTRAGHLPAGLLPLEPVAVHRGCSSAGWPIAAARP